MAVNATGIPYTPFSDLLQQQSSKHFWRTHVARQH
jgi:hypothetical protein